MKAAFVKKYGSNEPLEIGQMAEPVVQENDVLVKIHAASLNPIDFKIRNGMLRLIRSFQFTLVLGHDCAGVVVGLGSKATKFKIGDSVFARPQSGRGGTLAEFIAIDQNDVAKMPANLTFEEAASLPLVGLTAWQALVEIAHLKSGQKIFIPAGSGGVGTFAIQLAKYLGAEVWTTTSAKNTKLVQDLGADHALDYNTENFEASLKDLDVVLDTLGKKSLNDSFNMVKPGGWIVSISGIPDHRTARDMGLGLLGSIALGIAGLGMNLKAAAKGFHYRFLFMQPSGDQLKQIAQLVEANKIKPVVDKVFPFDQCQAAIEYSESGRARGKIIVKIV